MCAGIVVKISVERLFGPDTQAIEFDERVRLAGQISERYPEGVRVVASVRHIEHGVYMEGYGQGHEVETCARCLELFLREVRVDIAEAFSEDVRPEEELMSDLAPLVDRTIDVGELVGQLLEVDEPMAAICSEKCRGICPMCGANRNQERCECRDDDVDERLVGLAKFMQEPGVN